MSPDPEQPAGATAPTEAPSSKEDAAGPPLSGLSNPAAAVRGVGMATLILEAVVLLLAMQPVRQLSSFSSAVALSVVGGLCVACVVGCVLLRARAGWAAGVAIQILVIVAGIVHWSLAVVGIIFLAIWVFVLRLRRLLVTHPKGEGGALPRGDAR